MYDRCSMFVKPRFYYRACNPAPNGVQVEKVMTILPPVRSDVAKFQTATDFMPKMGFKDEEEGV